MASRLHGGDGNPVCNLYSLTRAREAILRLFRVSDNLAAAFEPKDAIFPGHAAPVIRTASDGERELQIMSWGFVLPQPGKAPRRVTNVRDDKVRSRFWNDSFEMRRCLVPASSFCEPNSDVKPATWHWFAVNGEDPRPLFAFPGVWRRHRGPIKKDSAPVELDVFAFLTTTPNALVETINHERMPVLLTGQDAFETWLRGSADEAFTLVRPHPAEAMRMVQAGLDKQDLGSVSV